MYKNSINEISYVYLLSIVTTKVESREFNFSISPLNKHDLFNKYKTGTMCLYTHILCVKVTQPR